MTDQLQIICMKSRVLDSVEKGNRGVRKENSQWEPCGSHSKGKRKGREGGEEAGGGEEGTVDIGGFVLFCFCLPLPLSYTP